VTDALRELVGKLRDTPQMEGIMRIISLHHPEEGAREQAFRLHFLIAEEIFHFIPESDDQFRERHKDKRVAGLDHKPSILSRQGEPGGEK